MNYRECERCNGTGNDDAAWDGRCSTCKGTGAVLDDEDDWYRQEDEDDGSEDE